MDSFVSVRSSVKSRIDVAGNVLTPPFAFAPKKNAKEILSKVEINEMLSTTNKMFVRFWWLTTRGYRKLESALTRVQREGRLERQLHNTDLLLLRGNFSTLVSISKNDLVLEARVARRGVLDW